MCTFFYKTKKKRESKKNRGECAPLRGGGEAGPVQEPPTAPIPTLAPTAHFER